MNGTTATLPYARTASEKGATAKFVGGTVLLAFLFFVVANVVEGQISDYLAANGGRLGPLSLDAATERHLLMHGDADGIVEFVWSIPASIAFAIAAGMIGPGGRWRLRWTAWVTTLLGAALYSAVRWVPDLVHDRLGEGADFVLAILLAVAAGLATGYARRPQH